MSTMYYYHSLICAILCIVHSFSAARNIVIFFFVASFAVDILQNELVTFCSIDKSIDFKNGYKQHFFAILQTFFYHLRILSANTKNIVSKDNTQCAKESVTTYNAYLSLSAVCAQCSL